MTERELTIQEYEVEGYSFEQTSFELETGGYNVTIRNVETEEILVDKTMYSITGLIDFFENERPVIIVEWVTNKLEEDNHESN